MPASCSDRMHPQAPPVGQPPPQTASLAGPSSPHPPLLPPLPPLALPAPPSAPILLPQSPGAQPPGSASHPPPHPSFGSHHAPHGYFQQQHSQQNYVLQQQQKGHHARHVSNQQQQQQHQHQPPSLAPSTQNQAQAQVQQQQQKQQQQHPKQQGAHIASPTATSGYHHALQHALHGHQNHHSHALLASQSQNHSSSGLQHQQPPPPPQVSLQALPNNPLHQNHHHLHHSQHPGQNSRPRLGSSSVLSQGHTLSAGPRHPVIPLAINSPASASVLDGSMSGVHNVPPTGSLPGLAGHFTGAVPTAASLRAYEHVENLRREIDNMCQDNQGFILQRDELEKRLNSIAAEISTMYNHINDLERNQKTFKASLEEEIRLLRTDNLRLEADRNLPPPSSLFSAAPSSGSIESQKLSSNSGDVSGYPPTPQQMSSTAPQHPNTAFGCSREDIRLVHQGPIDPVPPRRKRPHSQYSTQQVPSSSSAPILSPLPPSAMLPASTNNGYSPAQSNGSGMPYNQSHSSFNLLGADIQAEMGHDSPPATGQVSSNFGPVCYSQILQGGQLAPMQGASQQPISLHLPRRSAIQQNHQQSGNSNNSSSNISNSLPAEGFPEGLGHTRGRNQSATLVGQENAPQRDVSSSELNFRSSHETSSEACFTSEYTKEGHGWSIQFRENLPIEFDLDLHDTLKHSSVVCCVRFSPNGQLLATGSDRSVIVWNMMAGSRIATLRNGTQVHHQSDLYVRSVCFSADSRMVASSAEDRTIRLWNYDTSEVVQVFNGHEGHIYSLGCSPDGKYLASGAGDRTARIWDMETGACAHKLAQEDSTEPEAGVTCVCFSPCSRILATGSLDRVIRLYDVELGTELDTLVGHTDSVYCVAFRSDGMQLASAALDSYVRLWDLPNYFSNTLAAGTAAAGPSATSAAVIAPAAAPGPGPGTGQGTGTGPGTAQGQAQGQGQGSGASDGDYGLTESPNIVCREGDAACVNIDRTRAKCVNVLEGHTDFVLSVVYTKDGRHVISGSKDRTLRIWDPTTNETVMVLTGHKNSVISVAVSPSGQFIATGAGDGRVRLWRLEQFSSSNAKYAANMRLAGPTSGSGYSYRPIKNPAINGPNPGYSQSQQYFLQGSGPMARHNTAFASLPMQSLHQMQRHTSPPPQLHSHQHHHQRFQHHSQQQQQPQQHQQHQQSHEKKDSPNQACYQRHATGSQSPDDGTNNNSTQDFRANSPRETNSAPEIILVQTPPTATKAGNAATLEPTRPLSPSTPPPSSSSIFNTASTPQAACSSPATLG